MEIRLRFVGFGTRFAVPESPGSQREAGWTPPRDSQAAASDASRLFPNEIAVDVGGARLGQDGESKFVLDHHFAHGASSASRLVVESSREIQNRFSQCSNVWIVTHEAPDFDALCSVYLAYCSLRGEPLHSDIGWVRALVDYADAVDNCKKMSVPKTEALHSVLYAAIQRGRDMRDLATAVEFFTAVRRRIAEDRLNPACDALFDASSAYAPELRLLQRETDAYARDLRRARRCLVALQHGNDLPQDDFSWYARACQVPLLDAAGNLNPEHTAPVRFARHRIMEGIILRDPQCLLFKEWARDDFENSSWGQGFTFSLIAYSNRRPEGKTPNSTEYFISLDPERAAGAHLYNVWARLQAQEAVLLEAAGGPGPRESAGVRSGFEGRAGGRTAGFRDPWFDGPNYRCTIIATPRSGTMIGGKATAADMSDDAVAAIVCEEVEHCMFAGSARVWDFQMAEETLATHGYSEIPVRDAAGLPFRHGCFRFVEIGLDDAVDPGMPALGEQIGRRIWAFLDSPAALPGDFLQSHFMRLADLVIVWSRHGVAVAVRRRSAEAERIARDLRDGLARMAKIAWRMQTLAAGLARDLSRKELDEHMRLSQTLLKDIVQLKLSAAAPDGLALRRVLDASHLNDAIESADDLNEKLWAQQEAQAEEEQKVRDRDLQLILALGTALGLGISWNQMESLGFFRLDGIPAWVRFGLGLLLAIMFFACIYLRCLRKAGGSK